MYSGIQSIMIIINVNLRVINRNHLIRYKIKENGLFD